MCSKAESYDAELNKRMNFQVAEDFPFAAFCMSIFSAQTNLPNVNMLSFRSFALCSFAAVSRDDECED